MTKKEFLKKYNLAEDQFYGKEKITGYLDLGSLTSIPEGFNPTVGGYLDLRSLTSIPEGFNPTVGGLDLRSLTSIPEGFNPTVGGDLDLRSGRKYIGAQVPEIKRPSINLTWKDGEYTKIDGIFCEVISAHVIESGVTIIHAKKINKDEYFFISRKGDHSAHGKTMQQSTEDLHFKIITEKLKKEPINKDTLFTVKYYRTLTGACDFGCRQWMEQNKIPFEIINEQTVEKEPIKAVDLLPLLKKSNAYGLERFEKLITF